MPPIPLLLACADDPTPPAPPPPAGSDTGAVVGTPLATTSPAALLPANDLVPLVRELEVSTNLESVATVTWTDGERIRSATSGPSLDHHVLLVRNRPDRAISVSVDLASGDEHLARSLAFHTPPLPEGFPDLTLHASAPDRMSPGDTLLGLSNPDLGHFQVVVDPGGEVVWLMRTPERYYELQLQDDGLLLGTHEGKSGIQTLDWAGRVHRSFVPAANAVAPEIPVDVENFHHDVQRLEDGRLVALTYDDRAEPSFPVSYDDPSVVATDELVRSDRAIVFDPDDGAITEAHDTRALLPMGRLGYDALDVYGGARDWTHANAVDPGHDPDTLLLSSRNQDALLAVDRRTGELAWLLAPPANWPAEWEDRRLSASGAPFDWPYHAHAPEWRGDRLLLFDNGNERASPWTGVAPLAPADRWSRVVELRVDEVALTASLVWSFEVPGARLYVDHLGDCDRLPNGHVLGLFGQVVRQDGRLLSALGLGDKLVRVVEFEPATGEVAWDLQFSSPREVSSQGWNSFRAQRIAW